MTQFGPRPAAADPRAHVIRLRDPWELETTPDGRVQLVRHFNRPTGIDSRTRIRLAFERLGGSVTVTLNEHPLDAVPGAGRVEVGPLLESRNRVTLESAVAAELSMSQPASEVLAELAGAVWLELRDE